MECERNKKFMLRYVEGNINEKEMLLLSEHIGKCDDCREEFLAYCEISEEFNSFDVLEKENMILSKEFEGDVMKNISGVEFKTEKFLICILGLISLFAALIMFIEVLQNNVFYDSGFVEEIIDNSKNFTDRVLIYIGFSIGAILKFISEFLFVMKPFSLCVVILALLGKFVFNIFNLKRGKKNV